VLGVIDHGPATQSEVARIMGLTRQSVRETAAALEAEGLIALEDNPHHRRAKLMALTDVGRRRLREVETRQAAWANRIAARLPRTTLATLVAGMQQLGEALEADAGEAPHATPAAPKREGRKGRA
jgi:DNA-binding MarR family transcriptional regulator